jgi:hypothetical protein
LSGTCEDNFITPDSHNAEIPNFVSNKYDSSVDHGGRTFGVEGYTLELQGWQSGHWRFGRNEMIGVDRLRAS